MRGQSRVLQRKQNSSLVGAARAAARQHYRYAPGILFPERRKIRRQAGSKLPALFLEQVDGFSPDVDERSISRFRMASMHY